MTPSGNSFGRVILFNAFGHHGYGNLIISFSVAISYFSMPFSQSNTLSRAELILIQTMKIEYYNKVSVSFIFLLNEKKKEKKKKEEEITTSRSILLLTMIVWDDDTNFLDQN